MLDQHGQTGPCPASFVGMLPLADRAELRRIGQRRFFAAGSIMVQQDERSNHIFVILHGCVKVDCASGEGYHTVLALRDAGDLIGELASMDGSPRSATLCALTDVDTLLITAARFEMLRRSRPAVDLAVRRLLTTRLRESDRSLATVGAGSAVGRLARILLRLGRRYGTPENGGVRIGLPLSQDDLAGLTYTSQRTIGRLLAEWRDAGWIITGRRSMLLLDLEALDALRSS
jgi:CRP-like cAMP-binding protein